MTTGIVILGIVAVLLFFGAAERYFDRLGMTSWLTFLIVLALIIGAVMPEVRAERFVMTVGGFVVPTVVFILIFVLSVRGGSNALRILVALAAVGAIVTAFRLLTGIATTGALTAFFLLSGVIGGAVAMAAGGTRTGRIPWPWVGCLAQGRAARGFFAVPQGTVAGIPAGWSLFFLYYNTFQPGKTLQKPAGRHSLQKAVLPGGFFTGRKSALTSNHKPA